MVVHADAVGRAAGIVFSDALQRVPDGAVAGHGRVEETRIVEVVTGHSEPQWCVRSITVGCVLAVNGVRQRAVLLEPCEGQE